MMHASPTPCNAGTRSHASSLMCTPNTRAHMHMHSHCTHTQPPQTPLPAAESVRALPTFILFKDKQRIADLSGARAEALRKLIDENK